MISKKLGESSPTKSISEGSIMTQHFTDEMNKINGAYHVECISADGTLKWEDDIENLITTAGKNDILDKYFAGSAYTANMYMGLVSSVSYAAGPNVADTHASHAGWTECGATNAPNYGAANRPSISWSAASGGSKGTASAVQFTMSGSGTVKGCLVSTNNTKDGSTGTLVSVGTFSGGDKTVAASDILNVTYTAQLT